jgi:hypothetical protein
VAKFNSEVKGQFFGESFRVFFTGVLFGFATSFAAFFSVFSFFFFRS